MNLKTRLATLEQEAKAQAPQDRLVFFTRAGKDDNLIIGFKYQDEVIMKLLSESVEELQKRAGDIALSKRTDTRAVCFLCSILN